MPFDSSGLNITIVGATGAVGQEILSLLQSSNMALSDLSLVASKRSLGKTCDFMGQSFDIQDVEVFDFSNSDVVFFSAGGSVSDKHARRAAQSGALVIDNTNAFRMAEDVPLIVPQVNGDVLSVRPASGIISNPNCSTIQLVRALFPLKEVFGISSLFCATYQAASGGGLTGINELKAGIKASLDASEQPEPNKFPTGLAFNVIPQIDVFLDSGMTLEEQKMRQETRKILGDNDFSVLPFAVRVPVLNGHCLAVIAECSKPFDMDVARSALSRDKEIILHEGVSFPHITDVSGQNYVHVARLHCDPEDAKRLYFWVAADNLRVGAALNAVQIAEYALETGVL